MRGYIDGPPEHRAGWCRDLAKPGDYVIFLGAGNITQWAYALPKELRCADEASVHDRGRSTPGQARRQAGRLARPHDARCRDGQDDLVPRRRAGGGPVPAADEEDLAAFLKAVPEEIPV